MKAFIRSGRGRWLYISTALILLAGYGCWALMRPLPRLRPTRSLVQLQTQTTGPKLVWPTAGQSTVGIADSQVLETHNPQTPAPIASTAKMLTALMVLRQKPLTLSQQGPTITLTPADVALYRQYAAKNGSVVPVQAGEQISEYQVLQTMMLPSANNMADSLAIWAYGSLDAYAAAANAYLSNLGLRATHVGSDASGFSPDTTSTAHDLVRLGELAMDNPVLAQIVGQSTATGIPMAGTVKNVNFLLGNSGIIGVKTGNTDQAGGVFVSASRVSVNHKPATIVTAIIDAPSLFAALKNSLPLIKSAQANFKPVSIVKAGAIVGRYHMPWGGSVAAIASQDLSLTAWNNSTITSTIQLRPIEANTHAGQIIGSLSVPEAALADQKSVTLKLQNSLTKPSIRWRLLHPLP